MTDWWTNPTTDVTEISPEDLVKMQHAFWRAFYEHPQCRQVYAYLRTVAKNWEGTNDQVVALLDMLELPKVFCCVDEIGAVKAEAQVAQAASVPDQIPAPSVPGYAPGAAEFNQDPQKEKP